MTRWISILAQRCFLALLFLQPLLPSHAAQTIGMFEKGNTLYEQQKYQEAAAAYETLIQQKHGSPEILFNLGNAYFKDGQTGRAIINYRRAALLAPRDPDIHANLRFTRDAVRGDLSIRPGVLARALSYVTLNELAWLAALFFWCWLALWMLRLWKPDLRRTLRTSQLIAGALFSLSLLALVLGWAGYSQETAIVLRDQAPARFGPLEESQIAFTASDGTELRVLDRKDDWIQTTDRTGRVAWVRLQDVAIFPWPRAKS